MKICKICQAEMADELTVCSVCGAELENEEAEVTEEVAETAEEIIEEAEEVIEEAEEVVEEAVEEVPAKKKSPVAAIVIAVLAVLAAAAVIFFVTRGKAPVEEPVTEPTTEGETEVIETHTAHHVNAHGYNSHSIHYVKNEDGTYTYDYLDENGAVVNLTQEEVDALLDTVVATCGDVELTNRQIMYYYNEQYYNFSSTYGMYATMLLDSSKSMDEQLSMDGVNTWEQSFVSGALDMFQQMVAVAAQGKAEGYEPEESVEELGDEMFKQMNDMAQQYGFANSTAYVEEYFGPGATVESYVEFYKLNLYAVSYINYLKENLEVTEEDASKYFDDNAEYLQTQQGLTKTDVTNVNVRHILVKPAETEDDEGVVSITDEAWAEAEAEANRIYDEWKAGEATEESFAALATSKTQDPGSQGTGGLYEDVYPGQMVAEFNDWCFDTARKPGDTAVVKTSYGYHIMYFVEQTDNLYWRTVVDGMIKDEKISQMLMEMQETQPMTADQTKAVLFSAIAPTVPTEEPEMAEGGGFTNETEMDYGE